MRKRYKRPSKLINKSIKLLNTMLEEDEKCRGRFFIKNIGFYITDNDRTVPKNNNFVIILRFYDKETNEYLERSAKIYPKEANYVRTFAFYLYNAIALVAASSGDVDEGKDYRKISQDYTIKNGVNRQKNYKFTKRKD